MSAANGVHSEGGEGEVPRLRIITADEVDGLAELKEPVEAQAREQAREILEDIKVRPTFASGVESFASRCGYVWNRVSAPSGSVVDRFVRSARDPPHVSSSDPNPPPPIFNIRPMGWTRS